MSPMNTINPSVPNNHYTPKPQSAKPVKEDRPEAASVDARREAEPKAKAKGVMRLFESGHFEGKGVAELRLSINFFEQIQSLNKTKAEEATQQALGELEQFVSDTVEEFSVNPAVELPEEVQTFQNVLKELGAGGADAGSVGSAVHEAFASLVASLSPDASPDTEQASDSETDSNTETSVSDVTTAGSAPPDGELGFNVEALISTLETGVSNFEASLASATEVHQFVRPDGNGKAFDKFLEIYESLSADAVQQEGEDSAALLDQTA